MFLKTKRPLGHSATLHHHVHSTRSKALAIPKVGNATTSSWSSLGSNLSTCELRNHCRSDPVQVQSTPHFHDGRRHAKHGITKPCLEGWRCVAAAMLEAWAGAASHAAGRLVMLLRISWEPKGSLKNSGSHIDASLSRQPLVKGERLVRYEVNAVMFHMLALDAGTPLTALAVMFLPSCSVRASRAQGCRRLRQRMPDLLGRCHQQA